jgi:energy-coupling factor transporter ATP-binding protein EcfA2
MNPRFNPFSTRFVQPGAVHYFFLDGRTLEDLRDQFIANRGYGQIVGPHGSGKSTLLESLIPLLSNWTIRRFRFTTQNRTVPAELWLPTSSSSLLVIDGFEQLNLWTRWQIRRHCRKQGESLLVTAHRGVGLPNLFRAEVSAEIAQAVIQKLVPDELTRRALLQEYDLAKRLKDHHGSLREVLFELYDRWESLQRSSSS